MDNFDKIELQVSLNSVFHILKNRQTEMSENRKANLMWAIEFLDDVIKSIDSLKETSGQGNERIYYFVPNLKEIMNISKTSPEISKKEVIDSSDHYTKIRKDLESLLNDPRKFFLSPIDDTLETISKMRDIFSEDPYIVERDLTLSEVS